MREQIQPGLMVFTADGETGVGAVREVRPDALEMVINIENAGDFVVPMSAARDVHSGKVILDVDALDPALRDALHHVHDSEDPEYAASAIGDELSDIVFPDDRNRLN